MKSNRKIITGLRETIWLVAAQCPMLNVKCSFYIILFSFWCRLVWWVLLFRQKETLDGLTNGCVCMWRVLFSMLLDKKQQEKQWVNPNAEWFWNIRVRIFARPYMFIYLYLVLHIIVLYLYLSPVICKQLLNTRIRYIWHKRASSAILKLVYALLRLQIKMEMKMKMNQIM